MTKVFIDGSSGTTGLRIHERLAARDDIELLTLDEAHRKEDAARCEMLNTADVAFLCLPDDAARQAVSMVTSENVTIIDTSTAHRVSDGWVYGFAEISGYENVKNSRRIANPGCHASGFISLVAPLVKAGIVPKNAHLVASSLTGYSGGGKKMIAQYEESGRDELLGAPRQYGISQMHKHLPEMQKVCGLEVSPVFCPIVADFYAGMEVTVSLFGDEINGRLDDIKNAYREFYKTGLVRFNDNADESGFLSASKLSGRDDMEISVFGNDERILLVSRFDNLGKGASGAAIQNMNIVLGVPENTGLIV